jgi:hypothetical protein
LEEDLQVVTSDNYNLEEDLLEIILIQMIYLILAHLEEVVGNLSDNTLRY